MPFAEEGVKVDPGFGDHRLRRQHIDAIDSRPVDASQPVQFAAQIKGRSVTALFLAFRSGAKRLPLQVFSL